MILAPSDACCWANDAIGASVIRQRIRALGSRMSKMLHAADGSAKCLVVDRRVRATWAGPQNLIISPRLPSAEALGYTGSRLRPWSYALWPGEPPTGTHSGAIRPSSLRIVMRRIVLL